MEERFPRDAGSALPAPLLHGAGKLRACERDARDAEEDFDGPRDCEPQAVESEEDPVRDPRQQPQEDAEPDLHAVSGGRGANGAMTGGFRRECRLARRRGVGAELDVQRRAENGGQVGRGTEEDMTANP